jgi:mono/diheme cytochrome c family protein
MGAGPGASRRANILLHGVSGKLTVKDTVYNGQMPPFKDKLNDAEIAAVLNYVAAASATAPARSQPIW